LICSSIAFGSQLLSSQAGLLPAIFNACTRDTRDCSKEARWAIMNAITGANRAQTAFVRFLRLLKTFLLFFLFPFRNTSAELRADDISLFN
jgi:hypothetical protein